MQRDRTVTDWHGHNVEGESRSAGPLGRGGRGLQQAARLSVPSPRESGGGRLARRRLVYGGLRLTP
eukprot:504922-Hanusia_phi.AAC.1